MNFRDVTEAHSRTVQASLNPLARLDPAQRVFVYPAWGRLALSLLLLWRWIGVWWVSLLVLLASDPPVTPPLLLRLVAIGIVVPFILEMVFRRAYRARTFSEPETLRIAFRSEELEIPRAHIAAVRPWRVPLPGPGLALLVPGGKLLRERVEVPSPRSWAKLHGLALEEGSRATAATLAFAEARAASQPWRWYHYVAKFFVFGLIPAALLFQVHQRIAYGSVLGEYYLRGPAAYLRTWAVYYGTVVVYLLLFAGLLRSVLEVLLWFAAQTHPQRAIPGRRAGERLVHFVYYLGVLLLLALRFSGCG